MPKLYLNFLVLETFERLKGVEALLETLDKAIPTMEWQEQEDLKRFAEDENWDYGDYRVERDLLEDKFRHWIPRFAAYSLIILSQSIVETQLMAYAEQVGKEKGTTFRLRDLKGRGAGQAALFLQRATSLDVRKDPAWKHLEHLQELRNAIVHRGGKQGETQEHRAAMEQVLQAYPGKIIYPNNMESVYGQMWVSMELCRQFVDEIEYFFKRLFKNAGYKQTGIDLEA